MNEGWPASRVRCVAGFAELVAARFIDGINAVCWPRRLAGDFAEVVKQLGPGEGIVTLERERLAALPLSAAGRCAAELMLADLEALRACDLEPALNCIYGYPRDEAPGPIATDVFSFHVDSAPVEAETWLCTYHGPASEGLCNEDAQLRIAQSPTRAALLKEFGGPEGAAFEEFLREHCYDLHFEPVPGARPYPFHQGHLWKIAVAWPGSPVPPCIHRAPTTGPLDPPRLLLIS